jgi:hypothetical protein
MIKKFVHLIRDPFDNCVSRMHHGLGTIKSPALLNNLRTLVVDDPFERLRKWCAYLDESFHPLVPKYIWDRHDAKRLLSVPCHAEFIRYVSWHNAVINMTTILHPELPVYRLYYENYTANFGGLVRELYEGFLRYPLISARPKKFFPGKTYHYLFTPEEKLEIAYLIKSLASPDLWQLLRHYFSDVKPFNYTHDGIKRSIALLLSFPNSVGISVRLPNTAQVYSRLLRCLARERLIHSTMSSR